MVNFYSFKNFEQFRELFQNVTMKSSDAPYTFSLALHTGEEKKQIIKNREEIQKCFDLKVEFIVANQTHSDHIEIIKKRETKGWSTMKDAVENCDALITNLHGVVLTILTADCVPILMYDREHQVIAAVHAGWKGTRAKILSKTVQKMKEVFGTEPSNVKVGIAPSIGKCCYEVGEDVAKYFFDIEEGVARSQKKYMLDLPLINKKQLLELGVKEENIEMSHICTSCNVNHFFSYRKEKGCSGRFMSMIGIL